jgi:DNA-binding transcriptional MerR regulator
VFRRYTRALTCSYVGLVPEPALLTTPQLARALGLSISSVRRYAAAGQIKPELTTPGGHYRWSVESVRQQLRELQQRTRNDG